MTVLKHSEKLDEIHDLYTDLWTELSEVDETEAHKLLHSFSHQINLVHAKKQSSLEFKEIVKSPRLYLAIIVGLAIPVIIYVGFIYTSLSLE